MHQDMTEILLKLVLNTNQSSMRFVSKNCILAVWIVLTHESKLFENMKHEIVFCFGDLLLTTNILDRNYKELSPYCLIPYSLFIKTWLMYILLVG